MKPTMNLKPGESPAAAIIRLYKHIRRLDPGHKPGSHYAGKAMARRAHLRVVK